MTSTSGGSTSTGGSAATGCDTSSCDQLVSGFGALGIKSCCVSGSKCGIDTSGIGMLLGGGAMLPACIDPSAFTGMMTMPPPIKVLDGGIIPVDNNPPIQLDSACPDITAQGYFDLPGCCRPGTNTCGGSTHTLTGAGTTVPLFCASYDDVAAAASAQFGNTVVVPDDPNIRCKYTAAPVGVPDSGAPDAGAGGSGSGSGGAAGGGGDGGGTSTGGSAGAGGTNTGGAGGTNTGGAGGTNTGGAGGTSTGGAGGTSTGGAAGTSTGGAGGSGGAATGGAGGTSVGGAGGA